MGKCELTKVKEEAQNPLFYNENVYVFVKNKHNEYRLLESLDDSQTIEIKDQLIEIASSSNGIYCIENKSTDDKNHTTEFQIKDLTTNTPILSTTRSIGQLKASTSFVTWLNFYEDVPCVYNVSSGNIIMFSELTKGTNTFYIKDNYGILVHSYDDFNDVYMFEAIQ